MITVVYPPFIAFHHMMQRPQQLFKHLARRGVQAIYHDPGMSGRNPPFREIESNLYLLSRDASLHSLPHHPPVLWISYPPYWQLVNRYYNERLVVFDVCDAAADEFSDWDAGTEKMLERADLVLCSSWPLYEQYRERHPSTYLCPNGVDYDHFATPSPAPSALQELSGPIIGYHGAVASWLDWDLIESAVQMHPDWNFVFVGPPYNLCASQLPQRSNLIYCGPVPYHHLAGYVQAFDAGIVPFQVKEMTRASDPIKAYEYLAAGVGVVGTRLPQLETNPCVRVADDASAFIDALEAVLAEGETQRRWRQIWAKNQSWATRARVVLAALEAHASGAAPDDSPCPAPSRMQQDIATFLNRQVPASSYLEVGAGTGLTSAALAPSARRVATVDILPESLAACRRHRGVESYRADMFNLPFADGEFAVVWNAGVLEHYEFPKQLEALREMKRVAREAVVVAVPHRRCLPYRLGRAAAQRAGVWPYGHEQTYVTLAPLFEQAGLFLEQEADICKETGYWFMDQYLPGWRDVTPSTSWGDTGYLLAGIGRPIR